MYFNQLLIKEPVMCLLVVLDLLFELAILKLFSWIKFLFKLNMWFQEICFYFSSFFLYNIEPVMRFISGIPRQWIPTGVWLWLQIWTELLHCYDWRMQGKDTQRKWHINTQNTKLKWIQFVKSCFHKDIKLYHFEIIISYMAVLTTLFVFLTLKEPRETVNTNVKYCKCNIQLI